MNCHLDLKFVYSTFILLKKKKNIQRKIFQIKENREEKEHLQNKKIEIK